MISSSNAYVIIGRSFVGSIAKYTTLDKRTQRNQHIQLVIEIFILLSTIASCYYNYFKVVSTSPGSYGYPTVFLRRICSSDCEGNEVTISEVGAKQDPGFAVILAVLPLPRAREKRDNIFLVDQRF
jgi:hypothetical protein